MEIHMSKKITVIGAGSVGATVTYTLSVMGVADEIVMIDINETKVLGEALDIRQGLPFCGTRSVYAGSYAEAENSDMVIITSGLPRKPGQTRLELAQVNVDILKGIMPKITKYAPDAIYLLVANPVDILTYTFVRYSGIPKIVFSDPGPCWIRFVCAPDWQNITTSTPNISRRMRLENMAIPCLCRGRLCPSMGSGPGYIRKNARKRAA